MNSSTWTIRAARHARGAGRLSYLAGLVGLAASLHGCPLDEPTGGSPDGGGGSPDGGVFCTEEYFPVCGVDGVTYSNGCHADAAGVAIAHTGTCDGMDPVRCGGPFGNTCGADEYCELSPGIEVDPALPYPGPDADIDRPIDPATGICRPLPTRYCGGAYGNTCGEGEYCDVTGIMAPPQQRPEPLYDAGIAPPAVGICRPIDPPNVCGPNGAVCPTGYHCEYDFAIDLLPPDTRDGGAPIPPPLGRCVPDDEPGCRDVTDLVCGSNGITYQNACVAESMGVDVVSRGRCPRPDVRACGGWLGDTCTDAEYCYFEPETFCDYADASGVCRPRPEGCSREFNPVCGCNGQTYSNPCHAASSGTSVAVFGSCDMDPAPGGEGSSCGGLLGAGCDRGLFCNYPEEALCGAADQTGICATMPQACPLIWRPVCGCDGDIYGNACEAQAAGVSLAPMSSCLRP